MASTSRGPALATTTTSQLPVPRGPMSEWLVAVLRRGVSTPHRPFVAPGSPLEDDDLQLALYCCYELHYRGFEGVAEDWEWDSRILDFRHDLECVFEQALRSAIVVPESPPDVQRELVDLRDAAGFSLSEWSLQNGTFGHAQEFAIHRSGYQLKEADPHTWGIPRLHGHAKAAFVTIQADEYGRGVPAEMHSNLFADAMRALDLDASYGAYLDRLPAVTLATTNLISMFGLHRRLRGALVGHLASFEMNSVGPMARYSEWLETLGVPAEGRRFYDVHVSADEVHQDIALYDLVGGFLKDEPEQAAEVLFGAWAVTLVENAFAAHLATSWREGRSSLRW